MIHKLRLRATLVFCTFSAPLYRCSRRRIDAFHAGVRPGNRDAGVAAGARQKNRAAREWFRHPFGTPSRAGVLKRDGGAFPSAAPPGCAQFTPTRSSAGMARHGAGCAPRRSSRPSNLFSGLRPATTRYLGATALEKPFRQRPQSRWPAPPSRRFGCSDRVTGRL